MSTTDHAIKHSIQLTLGAGTDNSDLLVGKLDNIFHFHNSVFWHLNTLGAKSNLNIINHRESGESNLTTTLIGLLKNHTNTIDL